MGKEISCFLFVFWKYCNGIMPYIYKNWDKLILLIHFEKVN